MTDDARTITEAQTRDLLARRPTWMLLMILEATEATRDDFRAAGNDLGVLATVQTIDWTIDELDRRYPRVLPHWQTLGSCGHFPDLCEMFRAAYIEEVAR